MIQAHITVFLKEGVSTLKCPWYYRVCLYFLLSLICIYFYSHKSLFEEKRGKTAWMRESVRLFSLWVWIFWLGGGGVSIIVPLQPPSPCLSVLFWGLFFFFAFVVLFVFYYIFDIHVCRAFSPFPIGFISFIPLNTIILV